MKTPFYSISFSIRFLIALAGLIFINLDQSFAQTPAGFNPDYPAWGRILARCASPQGFHYDQLKADRADLDLQLAELKSVTAERFQTMTRAERLALLINAHNIHAVRRIVDAYPVKSISRTTWSGTALWRRDIDLAGRRWSLRSLRDEIMGSNYRESRAIFLLNWGMKGCAPLAPAPVTVANLEDLLERQTTVFMQDSHYAKYDRRKQRFHASKLLKEYRLEIERDYSSLWAFIRRFGPQEDVPYLKNLPPRFVWMRFDSYLNDLPPIPPVILPSDLPAPPPASK